MRIVGHQCPGIDIGVGLRGYLPHLRDKIGIGNWLKYQKSSGLFASFIVRVLIVWVYIIVVLTSLFSGSVA